MSSDVEQRHLLKRPGSRISRQELERLQRPRRILRPGDTCWRIERANRFALIVDAADYFAYAKAAMLEARRSILLIGWDFDLRIQLTPGDGEDDESSQLGRFIKRLIRDRPGLEIFILKWDMAVFYSASRQMLPLLALDLITHNRTHLRFDSTHPWASAHHQKIAVIDDSLAFCGGIDMTTNRWDTRGHVPSDPHRKRPNGTPYMPWHDATAAVDGPAARALGELARQRWFYATGKRLPAVERIEAPWPDGLEPQLRHVEVGIARTMPAYGGRPEIREIEGLYLEAIRYARKSIYLESQYFASARICEALAQRLQEPNGPEIVVINPLTTEGWLEEETMGVARDLCLKHVLNADCHGRFRIYYPVNEAEEPIYVHAKILIVDDHLIRVGSSNINNRSMGFDSESDLAVEAPVGDHQTRAAILRMRNDLLAEHLGVSSAQVVAALRQQGSLLGALDLLLRPRGRSLRRLQVRPVNPAEEAVAALHVADPERTGASEGRLKHALKRGILARPSRSALVFGLGVLAGLGVARWLRERSC